MTTSQQSRLGQSPEESIKEPVVASTVDNITLAGEQTLNTLPNGSPLSSGDRVLVKDQTNLNENGIYIVSATAWTRANDFNDQNDIINGQGVLDSNKFNPDDSAVWLVKISDGYVVDSSDIEFTRAIDRTGFDENDVTPELVRLKMTQADSIFGAVDFDGETEITAHGVPVFKTARRTDTGGLYNFKEPTVFPSGNSGVIPNFNPTGNTSSKRWERDNPFHIELAKYGIKSDESTDNTTELNYIITHMKDIIGGERMQQNVALIVPDGLGVGLSTGNGGITIDESNIHLVGASPGASIIVEDSVDNIINFEGAAAKSLYGCGIHNLRIMCRGNASAGYAIALKNCLDFQSSNVSIFGSYKGIDFNEVARSHINNIILAQNVDMGRTSGTPSTAFTFRGTNKTNTTVKISNFDISYLITNAPNYAMDIQTCDGLWFQNGHIYGGVLHNPLGYGSNVLASLFWSNVYHDVSNTVNIEFTGDSTAYRNFFYSNCYLGGAGVTAINVKNGTSPIELFEFTGGKVYGAGLIGLDIARSNANDFSFIGTSFDTNNLDNSASGADIRSIGDGLTLHGVKFRSTAGIPHSGTALKLTGATNTEVIGGSLLGSSAATKVVSGDVSNTISGLKGYANKVSGDGIIGTGTTSVVVSTGLDLDSITATTHHDIHITARSLMSGAVSIYSSGVVDPATGDFTVRAEAAPTADVLFNWSIDLE